MQISIKHCNNIEFAKLEIIPSKLNIKFGPNGTGKSTIAKAIMAAIKDRESGEKNLTSLTSFRNLNSNEKNPEVCGVDNLKSFKIFDEKYINEFVFQQDELLKGSFGIFIRGEEYEKGISEIEEFVEELKTALSTDQEIALLIQDFSEISNGFGKPTKNGFHGSSGMAKSLKGGNKVTNIPAGLEGYKNFIQHSDNYKWVKWQLDGASFSASTSECPYCITDIQSKKEVIAKIGEVYDPKSIENLNKIVAAFERLNKYFSNDARQKISEFVKNVDGYTDDQVEYLKEVKDQLDRLRGKFNQAQTLGFSSLKDVDKLIEQLKSYQIDIDLFVHLKSDDTIQKVRIVNDALSSVIEKAGGLLGSINRQKKLVERLVQKNSKEINSFLKNAGYSYHVKLAEDASGEHRLKLVHNDVAEEVTDVRSHLSFGERNAFALILFMFDVLKSEPDLILLDDPISSFDKNKKYAIMETLFRKGQSLRGKTVLFLTHDFEPIVDLAYHHTDRFEKPSAMFLENRRGQLTEKSIQKSDIQTFVEINTQNLSDDLPEINRLVYLRRLLEIQNNRNFAYDIISNLLHKRKIPTRVIDEKTEIMTDTDLQDGIDEVKKFLPLFDYNEWHMKISDTAELIKAYNEATNNYEKLHVYRILFDDAKIENIDSDVVLKFINEAFHIENSSIYQLNPRKYQLVPQYVIDECDKYVEQLG